MSTKVLFCCLVLGICIMIGQKAAAQQESVSKNSKTKRFYFYPAEQKKTSQRQKMILFPNPAKDEVEIRLENIQQFPYLLELMELTGKKVLTQEWRKGKIDLSAIKPGIYLLQLSREQERFSEKLLIKK